MAGESGGHQASTPPSRLAEWEELVDTMQNRQGRMEPFERKMTRPYYKSRALEFASQEIRADKAIVLEIVKFKGAALRFASVQLRADEDVVLAAIWCDGSSLEHASVALQADSAVVLKAVRQDGKALQYASDELRADREVVLEAVRKYGDSLRYASDELRADKSVVLEAVRQYGWGEALRYASDELRADRDVVLEAVRQYGESLRYASEDLQGDKEIVREAVRNNFDAWEYAPDSFEFDKDIAFLAARSFLRRERRGDFDLYEALKIADIAEEGADSYIAMPGEEGPVVTVTVSHMEGNPALFRCEVVLLSGVSFDCCMPKPKPRIPPQRPTPILDDLADEIATELPKYLKSWARCDDRQVFLNFRVNDDGDAVAVTPWDWNRPLSDFLFAKSS